MNPREKALSLCQEMGKTTLFAEDCNNGYTLPLRVAKLLAKIAVDEILNQLVPSEFKEKDVFETNRFYWSEVKKQIDLL